MRVGTGVRRAACRAAGTGARACRRSGAPVLWVLVCVGCALAAAGCGSGSGAHTAPAYEVRATTVKGLGRILADGHGWTLYLYVPDHQGPSVCSGGCALAWPPLLLPKGVTEPKPGPGVDAALLGTTRRADGRLQVTYNKWPLYLYQDDSAPGQVTGQADDMGLWYVVSAGGSIDRGVPAATS
jgi:predicted lipoprotein with Yx(FWY)xxD motif